MSLTAVDYNPFDSSPPPSIGPSAISQPAAKLTPVDHDPFASAESAPVGLMSRAWKGVQNSAAETAGNLAKLPFAVAPILPESIKSGLSHFVDTTEDFQKRNAAPPPRGSWRMWPTSVGIFPRFWPLDQSAP